MCSLLLHREGTAPSGLYINLYELSNMRFLSLFLAFAFTGNMLRAQYVYTINADSVKITNHCDTAELIIENHTQHVPGFLYNKERGRTEFRKVLQKLDPTTYLILRRVSA